MFSLGDSTYFRSDTEKPTAGIFASFGSNYSLLNTYARGQGTKIKTTLYLSESTFPWQDISWTKHVKVKETSIYFKVGKKNDSLKKSVQVTKLLYPSFSNSLPKSCWIRYLSTLYSVYDHIDSTVHQWTSACALLLNFEQTLYQSSFQI